MKDRVRHSFSILILTLMALATTSLEGNNNCNAPPLWFCSPFASDSQPESCFPPCICGWYLRGDAILWRASERGFDCDCISANITDTFAADGTLSTVINGEDAEFCFDWDAGFRLGIGFYFNEQSRVDILYTHLFTGANIHSNNLRDKGRIQINFDVLDFIFGRQYWTTFSLSQCWSNLSFGYEPYVGLRSAWINQKLRSKLKGRLTTELGTTNLKGCFHDREDFWGLGPEIGIEADLPIGYGITFFGNADIALLYGRYKTKFNDSQSVSSVSTKTDESDHFVTAQPVVDLSLGIRLERDCLTGSYLTFEIAWEHHRYIEYNQLGSGDLCLDGATLSASLQF